MSLLWEEHDPVAGPGGASPDLLDLGQWHRLGTHAERALGDGIGYLSDLRDKVWAGRRTDAAADDLEAG